MAGSGVAIRLHEFRERQGSFQPSGTAGFAPTVLRQGRDVWGLYPGQLGRVHSVHSQQYGIRSASLDHPLRSTNHSCEDYRRGFDLYTFHTLNVLRHSPDVQERRPPQTAYQEDFGLQSHLYPPDNSKFSLCSASGAH